MGTGKVIAIAFIVSLVTSAGAFFGLRALTAGRAAGVAAAPGARAQVVPPLAGLRPDQARRLLEPKGLLMVVTGKTADPRVNRGRIVSQIPLEGSEVREGSTVQVVLSSGVGKRVPTLVKLTLAGARQALGAAGLAAGRVTRQAHATVPRDHVISSSPAAGEPVTRGATVDLVVSDGSPGTPLPRVVGMRAHRARATLRKAGFSRFKATYRFDEDRMEGVVLGQDPAAGSSAAKDTTITLVVNREGG